MNDAAEAVRVGAAYGPHPQQVVDLHLPLGRPQRLLVVMIHGGFWAAGHDRSLQHEVVADLVDAGHAVANIDYRGVGEGGGHPGTLDDVAEALDLVGALTAVHVPRARGRVVVGHSAGGHLALWAATRHRAAAGSPGAPRPGRTPLRVDAVVAQAAVADLTLAHELGLGDGAVAAWLGADPVAVPERLDEADPVRLLPTGVPTLLVSGTRDSRVPHAVSQRYAEAARAAGAPVDLVLVDGEDHFEHLRPGTGVWTAARAWMGRLKV